MKIGMSRALLCPLLTMAVGCYGGSDGEDGEDPTRVPGGEGVDEDDEGRDSPDLPPGVDGPGTCVDTEVYFKEELWTPIVSKRCVACHNPNGEGKHTDLVLQMPDYPGYLEMNRQTMENISRLEIDGVPLLLLKPSGQVDHQGGAVLPEGSAEYEVMAEMIDRFDAPTHCVDDASIKAFFKGLVELDEVGTLRRATLALARRLPTAEEIAAVEGRGIDSLDDVLNQVMEEPAFSERLMEMLNDKLLTDAYLPGEDAVNTVDMERFPNAKWYAAAPDPTAARNMTNDMIAREPLELAAWIVRNHQPFTDVLTADFTIVNPYSARSYDIPLDVFDNPDDPGEKIPWNFEDLPQSGMLTTPVFLNRYPTTPTNRNRHRSRMVYDLFLATDMLRLAERPLDISAQLGHNPTMNNVECSVCHNNMDPLAGAFQNWDEVGHYSPPEEGWFGDMVPAGFGDIEVPPEEVPNALQWLTREIIHDPKFSLAVVHLVYTGLTGQEPLIEPTDPNDEDYLPRIRAFEAQDWVFKNAASRFVGSNYELRVVIRDLIKSAYFRAVGAKEALSAERALELADMGTARLMPPEQLHDRVVATTGYAWQKAGANALLSGDYYRYYYGGINSKSLTNRLTEMNGVMASIAERMANEVSCQVTGLDFAKDPALRLLFPNVELTDMPGVLGAEDRIRDNIVYLHDHLLGERIDADDEEVERTFQVFMGVWEDGQAGMLDPVAPYPTAVPGPCQATTDPATGEPLPPERVLVEDPTYTARAWMAVLNYMLADYEFLFE